MPLPHNPRTGEAVSVKALPHFKAGRGLRSRFDHKPGRPKSAHPP
jgi:nucleoid DNA-binding protein